MLFSSIPFLFYFFPVVLMIYFLVPDNLKNEWNDMPFSILCWANPDITIKRLQERNGVEINKWDNHYFCQMYLDIGERYHIPVVDTSFSTIDESVEKTMEIIRNNFGGVI